MLTFKFTPLWLVIACVCLLSVPMRAWCKDTGLIFVSNEKSDNIIVLDGKTLKVVKDLHTAGRPRDLHFNAAHTLLYVACGNDDVIEVIDVAKLTVVGKLNTGRSPEAFAIDESRQRLYVSNEESSSLWIIDMAQNITIQEVPTGAEPEGVLLSSDKSTLYVASEVTDMVHVIKADDGYVSDNIVIGTRPRRFAATPDGKELWVSTELSGEVWIIDRATNAAKEHLTFLPSGMRKSDVTPVGLVMTADGKTAFITLGHANHVAFVDVASRKILGYALVGTRAWGVGAVGGSLQRHRQPPTAPSPCPLPQGEGESCCPLLSRTSSPLPHRPRRHADHRLRRTRHRHPLRARTRRRTHGAGHARPPLPRPRSCFG